MLAPLTPRYPDEMLPDRWSPRVQATVAALALAPLVAPLVAAPLTAQDSARVSVLYTGRSLGALGVRRAQDEHELLTERAVAEGAPFKLVSHLAWRAPGVVVFLPSEEPRGDELAFVLERRGEAEVLDSVRAFISSNVLLLQDPWRPEPDLIAMIDRNPRRRLDFPDLVETRVRALRLRSTRDDRIIIIEQPGAVWPEDPAAWSVGEMNRVDVGDTRLFELPLNLGELGPRATLLREARDAAQREAGLVITVDLGHQDGDLGMPRPDRARLDFAALRDLAYSAIVPFEFELALGSTVLDRLRGEFPSLTLLSANVRAADTTLLRASQLLSLGSVRVGLIGLVNPTVRDRLPRSALADFRFEPAAASARREVERLRREGATAIVVLSNMDAADNALLAQEVSGIDAIVADMPVRWAPEATSIRVDLPERPFARPGPPALVARSAANGIGVGHLSLRFRATGPPPPGNPPGVAGGGPERSRWHLAAVAHDLTAVTDRTPPDTALVRRIASQAAVTRRPRGELMFPAFVDLADRHPALRTYDAVTAQGRVSKGMWEDFMARLLRVRGRAEVAVIRRLDQFPPLIGKLHENEIGAWLWTEDRVVLVDMLGGDLRALLRADTRGELATSGIAMARGSILGHRIDDQTYYRVATSDVLFDGARSNFFARGRRVRRLFTTGPDGGLMPAPDGRPVALKNFVFDELRRVRASARGDEHIDRIAALIAPDPAYVNLFSFTFERPTLWVSLSQAYANDGYGSVPESRVLAKDTWVAGLSGRFVLSHERRSSATDLGLGFAYARQGVDGAAVTESADDLKADLTLRPSMLAETGSRWRPFIRGLLDSEFTPTEAIDGTTNPRQVAARAIAGYLALPGPTWRRLEIGLAAENDFGRPNLQFGFQARADLEKRLGAGARFGSGGGQVTYRMRNDLTYFLPSGRDTEANLALRYNLIHELLIPLVDELSLSVVGDFFVYQGKVAATRSPGMNVQLRVGLTYDRLWKPRYQPFF